MMMNVQTWRFDLAHDFGLPLRQRLSSRARESSLVETIGRFVWWAAVRAYLHVFHRLRVEGVENIPQEPPFVLVANHSSHLDALVLAAQLCWRLRDCAHPIAAGDTFFSKPVVAAFAGVVLNALPMWRTNPGSHALRELRRKLLAERCVYIIFPEGTRTRDGRMNPFRAGIGMLVAGTNVPVIPCRLEGTFDALPPGRSWPMFFPIRLRVGTQRRFAEARDDRSGWETIARELEDSVQRLPCEPQG
jgi:1-acyl-sn-glycerol-3-phosphate acyltransferase